MMKTFVYGGEYRKSEQELDRSFNNACVEQFSGKQQNKARPQAYKGLAWVFLVIAAVMVLTYSRRRPTATTSVVEMQSHQFKDSESASISELT